LLIPYLFAKWQQRFCVCWRASHRAHKVIMLMFLLVLFAFAPLGFAKQAQADTANPPLLTERLQEVSQLYLDAHYEQARRLIDILDREYPNMVSVKILQARILFALGKLQEAEIIADWLDKGAGAQSKQIAQYLKQTIHQAKQKKKNYNFFSAVKIGNAINIRAVPTHRAIDYNWEYIDLDGFGLPEQAAPPNALDADIDTDKNEMFTDLTLGGVYTLTPKARQDMQFNFSGNMFARTFDTYDDNNDGRGDGDFRLVNLQTSALKASGNLLYEASLNTLWLDLSEAHFSTNYGASLGVMAKTNDWRYWPAFLRPKYVKIKTTSQRHVHKIHPSIANNNTRTGRKHSLHLSSIFTGDAKDASNLNIEFEATRYDQIDNSGNYTLLGAHADIGTNLPFAKLTTGLSYAVKQYMHAARRGTLSALWGLQRRRDEIRSAHLKLERDFAIMSESYISLALAMNWQQQRSNTTLYDVDNGEIGLVVAKKW